jgi:phage/plasmid primase-like uncharacterized protein
MNSVLYEALQARGIPYPKEEVALNKFTRWGKNSRYWAVGFEGGSFGDFARSERWETFEKNYDREKCKNEIRTVQKKLNEEKKYEQAKAAIAAQQEWNDAQNCESHPYLKKKRVRSHGLKIENDTLLISLFNENDNLVSLQKIFFDEREGKFIKKFHRGSRTKGCFLSSKRFAKNFYT